MLLIFQILNNISVDNTKDINSVKTITSMSMSENVRSKKTSKTSKTASKVIGSRSGDETSKPRTTSVLSFMKEVKSIQPSGRTRIEKESPKIVKKPKAVSPVPKRREAVPFKAVTDEELIPKELDILERCRRFFSADIKYINEMLSIINGESEISIRVIDWFVSNYSKKENTIYRIKVNGTERLFNVNSDYKNQLAGYSKLYFDPFCRKKKVIYRYRTENLDKPIIFSTSIGQLNFFQWAIKNKVIYYVQKHLKKIDRDMKETTRLNKEKKLSETIESEESEEEEDHEPDETLCSSKSINRIVIGSDKKPKKKRAKTRRHQLSQSPYDKGIRVTSTSIVIDFD
jgi:hypothetical protein